MTSKIGTLHEDLCTFMIVSSWILLRMRNVSDKSSSENQNTLYVQQLFVFPENLAVCEIIWKNVVEPDISQVTA